MSVVKTKKKTKELKDPAVTFSRPQNWVRSEEHPDLPTAALVLTDYGDFRVGYWSSAAHVWYGVGAMYGKENELPVIAYAMLPDPVEIVEFLSLRQGS